jgi:hypothetical protein
VVVFPVQPNEAKIVRCDWFHRDGCGAFSGGEPTTTTEHVPLIVKPQL